ncbi:hypothetical protein [Salarchaeum sp. JOR-1]|uniref:hypothetical protein n=1 Tax=Salarchaeum sp. JOR-1 TaxID=2599399 RepID=UPI0019806E3A|nr:hypothetical protein [Salarchaeum sp. JOR-1]
MNEDDTSGRGRSRRFVVAAVGATVAGLAGCSGNDAETTATDTRTRAPTATETATATPTTTATTTEQPMTVADVRERRRNLTEREKRERYRAGIPGESDYQVETI